MKRYHYIKSIKWIWKKYFAPPKSAKAKSQWILNAPDTKNQLKRIAWIPIVGHSLIKYCVSPLNYEFKDYFEERHQREFRRNMVESRQKLADIQKYRCQLCKQNVDDFTEKLVTQLKIPGKYGGNYLNAS